MLSRGNNKMSGRWGRQRAGWTMKRKTMVWIHPRGEEGERARRDNILGGISGGWWERAGWIMKIKITKITVLWVHRVVRRVMYEYQRIIIPGNRKLLLWVRGNFGGIFERVGAASGVARQGSRGHVFTDLLCHIYILKATVYYWRVGGAA